MSKTNYAWHGESVKVRFGLATVKRHKEKPLYWYNYECTIEHPEYDSAHISAVEITTKYGYVFVIANHFGIGVHKLLAGGWPSHQHFSISDDFKFTEHKEYRLYDGEFDLQGFEEHESARRKWQRENFPDEFEKSDQLRKLIRKP